MARKTYTTYIQQCLKASIRCRKGGRAWTRRDPPYIRTYVHTIIFMLTNEYYHAKTYYPMSTAPAQLYSHDMYMKRKNKQTNKVDENSCFVSCFSCSASLSQSRVRAVAAGRRRGSRPLHVPLQHIQQFNGRVRDAGAWTINGRHSSLVQLLVVLGWDDATTHHQYVPPPSLP